MLIKVGRPIPKVVKGSQNEMKLVGNPPIRIECGFVRCPRLPASVPPTHKKHAIAQTKVKQTANKAPIKPHTRSPTPHTPRGACAFNFELQVLGAPVIFPVRSSPHRVSRVLILSAVALYLRRRRRPD